MAHHTVTIAQLREQLADLITRVANSRRPIIVSRYRKPLVAVVPLAMLDGGPEEKGSAGGTPAARTKPGSTLSK